MKKSVRVQRSRIAFAVAGLLLVAGAMAQGRQALPDSGPVGGPRQIQNLACCKCLGETMKPLDLSTGFAPWYVNNNPAVLVNPTHPLWHQLPPAKWIGPAASSGQDAPAGVYTYETYFRVPKCLIPGAVTITGQFLADDEGTISLSGPGGPVGPTFSTPTTPPTPGWGFQKVANFNYTIPANAAPGVYSLTVNVNSPQGPTGLVVNASAVKRCVSEPKGPGGIDPPIDNQE